MVKCFVGTSPTPPPSCYWLRHRHQMSIRLAYAIGQMYTKTHRRLRRMHRLLTWITLTADAVRGQCRKRHIEHLICRSMLENLVFTAMKLTQEYGKRNSHQNAASIDWIAYRYTRIKQLHCVMAAIFFFRIDTLFSNAFFAHNQHVSRIFNCVLTILEWFLLDLWYLLWSTSHCSMIKLVLSRRPSRHLHYALPFFSFYAK